VRFPAKTQEEVPLDKVFVGWLLTIAGVALLAVTFLGAFLDFGLEAWPMSAGSVREVVEAMKALGELTIMLCLGTALLWAGVTCVESQDRARMLAGLCLLIAGVGLMAMTFLSAVLAGLPALPYLSAATMVALLAELAITLSIGLALFRTGRKLCQRPK
jgi:hypothetical protein